MITEAGARNNKVDTARIQEIHDHAAGLGSNCSKMDESADLSPWLREARAASLRANDSYSAKLDNIRKAVQGKYSNKEGWAYPRDVFDKHVVVQHGEKMYQHSYSHGSDGSVSLGDPCEVESTYTPVGGLDESVRLVAMFERAFPTLGTDKLQQLIEEGRKLGILTQQEAAAAIDIENLVPLVESAVDKDGVTRLKVIEPGWGSSGYYSPELLERDGPKAFPAGTKMYLDHPTPIEEKLRPERSVKDLTAVLKTGAAWDEKGPNGPGLYAEAEVLPQFREFVAGSAKHIGVSIRAAGSSKPGEVDGRKGQIIERIAHGKSIDFVTSAGAGGKILTEAGASAGSLRELYEAARSREGKTNVDENQTKELKEAQAEIARLKEGVILRDAQAFVSRTLADEKYKTVPAMTKQRLAESLAANPVVKDGKLDTAAYASAIEEAVKSEVAYLAAITGSGQVRGLGAAAPTEMAEAEVEKQLTESFQNTFGLSEAAAKLAAKGR